MSDGNHRERMAPGLSRETRAVLRARQIQHQGDLAARLEDLRGTADRGTVTGAPEDARELPITIDEGELQRRLARPEPVRRRRTARAPSPSPAADRHGSPSRSDDPAAGAPRKRRKPYGDEMLPRGTPRPGRDLPAQPPPSPLNDLARGTTPQDRSLETGSSGIWPGRPTRQELQDAADELSTRLGGKRRRQPRLESRLEWRERFYRWVLTEEPVAELLIGRRLREQAPIIERLLPILAPASGSRFVAENERIAMAVFFALMEQVAGLADSVVTGGLSVIQGGARLGLEVEELIQARDRLRVVRRQFASIVRQQGELPSQSMIAPAMALGRLFMHLWNLIVEMRDAQRNNQPFRFGRAAGHFSTAVVGVADVVQELRRSGVLAGEAMEELALHELPAPTAARNQLRANLLEAGQHPPGIGEYQAHHIIPYQLRTDKVIRRLDQAFPPRWDINGTRIGGWDINDAENGVWLPTRQEGPFAGRVASHSGPHGIYTSSIEGRLRTLNNEVESGLISDGELLDAVRSLQDEYRARFVSELKGVPLH